MARARLFLGRHSRILLTAGGVLLVLYVFVPQLGDLQQSLEAVKSADKTLLLLAIVIFSLGFPVLAEKYLLIAQYPLKFKLNLKVQTASAFVSKLLPMSIGSLTVNTYYLAQQSKSKAAAASTMAFNALTGSISFMILVIISLVFSWGSYSLEGTKKNISWLAVLGIVVLISIAIWILLRIKKIRRGLRKALSDLWQDFQSYRRYPAKIAWGIIFNGLGTLTGIATLYICCHSVGLPATLAQSILSYTLGNIVGSLVPTPGGLGGVEAGLYSGLVFFGYDTNLSLVAVMLYRLISYWIPIIPGYIVYRSLKKDVLSGFKIKSKKAQPAYQAG